MNIFFKSRDFLKFVFLACNSLKFAFLIDKHIKNLGSFSQIHELLFQNCVLFLVVNELTVERGREKVQNEKSDSYRERSSRHSGLMARPSWQCT